jgi:hypothetical protein
MDATEESAMIDFLLSFAIGYVAFIGIVYWIGGKQ